MGHIRLRGLKFADRDDPVVLVGLFSVSGRERRTLEKFTASRVYIFCQWGFLLSVKSFSKIFNGGSPAFSSTNLINLSASSAPTPTAGLPPRRFQILPLNWIPGLNRKEKFI
ncbi:MAG TPA: hypothetical protein DCR87_06700 [Acidobacteria bacterium]|nr:hypothetical protein [Acidobacteriota bacterium]